MHPPVVMRTIHGQRSSSPMCTVSAEGALIMSACGQREALSMCMASVPGGHPAVPALQQHIGLVPQRGAALEQLMPAVATLGGLAVWIRVHRPVAVDPVDAGNFAVGWWRLQP